MPFKPPVQAKCPKCNKSVYAAEERLAGGHKFHASCFKCGMCNKGLDSSTVTPHESEIYCKQCHGRKYGPKGYGFGQGAGTLGMDSGERFGNKNTEMSNVPTGNTYTAGGQDPSPGGAPASQPATKPAPKRPFTGGGAPKCPRCTQSVYDAEKAIGTSVPWHKRCFNCHDCHKSLDSNNMAMHEIEVYCRGCHTKNFGPKGYGFGGGSGALSMCQ